MERWAGKVAVVTGASGGIGSTISRAFCREGMIVVGLARRKAIMEEKIRQTIGTGKFYPFECDLRQEKDINDAFKWIKETLGPVQVLVNTAGTVFCGKISETKRQMWEDQFDVNVLAGVTCASQAIRMMMEADVEGHIININSIGGHHVYVIHGQHANVYTATKHAVTGYTAALQKELKSQKIRTTSISPGMVNTELRRQSHTNKFYSAEDSQLETEDIANAVIYVLGTPLRAQVTELTIRPLGDSLL